MAIKNGFFKNVKLYLLILSLLSLPLGLFAEAPTLTWKKTTGIVYLHKDLYVSDSGTKIALQYPCATGSKVNGVNCPSSNNLYAGVEGDGFIYTLSKQGSPSSNFPYYTYKTAAISRTTALPAGGWQVAIEKIVITSGTRATQVNRTFAISITPDGNTVLAIKSDLTTTNSKPANSGGDTGDSGDTGDTGGTTEPDPEPVQVGLNETVELDDTPVKTKGCGTDGKYTSGILKGVSCIGATKTKEEVVQIIKNIIEDFLLPFVGVLFITMLVIGGLVYITSGGNEESLKRAKKILTSGIIGFLIVVLSYTLIRIFVTILGGSIII